MAATALNFSDTMADMIAGAPTVLTVQPPTPSQSVLRARRRTLFGVELPAAEHGNTLRDLFNQSGTVLTIRTPGDLCRAADRPLTWLDTVPVADACEFPTSIELSEPWCLGAPGQQVDSWLAFALLHECISGSSRARLDPGPDDLRACAFTSHCRRNTPEYKTALAEDRALRNMAAVAPFKSPKVFTIYVRSGAADETTLPNGRIAQRWWPWQACTNCISVRAIGRCSSWSDAMSVDSPARVFTLAPGEKSEWDTCYGWFNEAVREGILGRDVGFYELWVRSDGTSHHLATK